MTTDGPDLTTLVVVAAVIRDDRGRILLTRRPEDTHMGGLWEFPGGKVEDGEDPRDALVRELREELAVEAAVGRPITFAIHSETGLRILLLFFDCSLEHGDPRPVDGQRMTWVEPGRLAEYPTPPADAELVRLLVDLDRPTSRDLR
jgi:8-oxo-dGTP diphosphatase